MLDKKLNPINDSIANLVADLSSFKKIMHQELQNYGLKLTTVESETLKMSARVKKLEDDMQALALRDPSVGSPTERAKIVVMGNIPSSTKLDDAKAWVAKVCKDAGIPQPIDIYSKGEFKGVVFAKCITEAHRDQIISVVSNGSMTSVPKTWAKADRPVDVRTAEGALFGFTRMLVDWGYNKSCIKIDTNTATLSVAGTSILKASVTDYVLTLSWCDGQWEHWSELQVSPELRELKHNSQEKLERAKASVPSNSKGKGKSPE